MGFFDKLLDIGGSVLGPIGSVVGSLINAGSQSDTNKMSLQMQREQQAYQTGEREATQLYNNPVNQRKRFEAAGINPYMALGQFESGNATAQSAPAAPTFQAPQYGDVIKNLGDSLEQAARTRGINEQNQQLQLGIEQMKIDTRYKLVEKLLQLDQMRADLASKKIHTDSEKKQMSLYDKQIERLQQDIKYFDETADEQKARLTAERKKAELDADAQELANDYQAFFNNLQKQLGPKQVDLLKAEISNQLSQINVNNKQSANIVADTAIKKAQEKGVKIDNFQKNKINWMIREGLRLDNKIKKWDSEHSSYVDQIFGSAESIDKRTGFEHRPTPKIKGLSHSWTDDSGTTRW